MGDGARWRGRGLHRGDGVRQGGGGWGIARSDRTDTIVARQSHQGEGVRVAPIFFSQSFFVVVEILWLLEACSRVRGPRRE